MIAILLALLAATNGAPAAQRPADGTYAYAFVQRGQTIGTSDVVFKGAGTTLTVQERATLGALQATTNTTLDASTLRELQYSGSSPQEGSFDVSLADGLATLHSSAVTIPLKAVAGSPTLLVGDGLVSTYAILPALVHASGIKTFTLAAINGAKALALTVGSAIGKPPANVPSSDAGMTVTFGGATATLWYDPETYVLDLLDNPASSMQIRLSSYSAAAQIAPTPSPAPTATPVPLPSARYTSRDVRFAATGGAQIAGVLTIPRRAARPLPTIVMAPGSGPQDRDETIGPNKIFLQLANAFSNHGYAVLRYDKRGIGKSIGTDADLRQNAVADVDAAFHYAQTLRAVQKRRIYLLGHSEGAMSVPIVAARESGIRGIILLAPPAIPLAQVIARQAHLSDAAYHRQLAAADARVRQFVASWAGYDPAKTIAKVRCPILVLQGGKDFQVLASDLPRLVNAARAAHRDITVRVLPSDDHVFLKVPAGKSSTLAEYYKPGYVDAAVASTILGWLRAH